MRQRHVGLMRILHSSMSRMAGKISRYNEVVLYMVYLLSLFCSTQTQKLYTHNR